MAVTQDMVESLQNLLDEELTDYNSDRSGRWIYNVPVNFDIANYPRIHVRQVSSTHQAQSIGSTSRYVEGRIRINVFNGVSNGYRFDIDGDGELESVNAVIDELKEDIIDLINQNQERWRNVKDCHIYSMTTESEESFNPNREDVTAWTIYAIIRRRTS